MLSIGEFSRVTRLSIKALRLYHRKGILVPDAVRLESRYRYYSSAAVDRARVVVLLKDMGFTLEEIKAMLSQGRDDRELAEAVRVKLQEVERTLGEYRNTRETLRLFLQTLESGPGRQEYASEVTVEDVPEILICGERFKGRYDEVGPRFGRLFRACGRAARGRPFSLYYDGEYKEDGADIEACVEVRSRVSAAGVTCRLLGGGRAAAVIHRGPYETLSRSYQKLFEYCRDRRLEVRPPIREQYLKGPGMIFRGNPRQYLTKLMVFVGPSGRARPRRSRPEALGASRVKTSS